MPEPSNPLSNDQRTRRDFLTQTVALAGAGSLLAACQTAKPMPRAMARPRAADGEPLRIGVIGTGGMGHAHVNSLLRLHEQGKEKLQVVAVADVCGPRAEKAKTSCDAKQSEPATAYRNHRDLLERDDLHGVLIASPEHWHCDHVEDAVAKGLDAYVEKPMTLRLPEAIRLLQVTRHNPDVIVQVGTQFVTHEKYHHARRLINEGMIGKPTFSQTSYCRNSKNGEWLYNIDPKLVPGDALDWREWCGPLGEQPWDPAVFARWRRYRKYSTGIVGDLLVHVMTPLVYALDQGWPTRVTASGGHYVDQEMENHDQVNLTVEFEKGHTLVVAGSTCNEKGLEIMIRGNQASLYLGSKDCVLRPERPYAEEIDEETIQCKSIADQDELRLDWMRSMRTREPNLSPVEFGTKVMVIVDLATRSMWEGSAFKFDPATMTATAV